MLYCFVDFFVYLKCVLFEMVLCIVVLFGVVYVDVWVVLDVMVDIFGCFELVIVCFVLILEFGWFVLNLLYF